MGGALHVAVLIWPPGYAGAVAWRGVSWRGDGETETGHGWVDVNAAGRERASERASIRIAASPMIRFGVAPRTD